MAVHLRDPRPGLARRTSDFFPDEDADGFGHDEEGGFSLFLQERCKRIFFIRHAEGTHNVAERESTFTPKENVLLAENTGMTHWDARLTPKGEDQCAALKNSIRGDGVWGYAKPLNLDLVVVSPLTRCLQTAVLSLGDPSGAGAPPFLASELCRERVADFMCDGHLTLTLALARTLTLTRTLTRTLARTVVRTLTRCDGHRNKSELAAEFPGVDVSPNPNPNPNPNPDPNLTPNPNPNPSPNQVDFSLLETEEDELFKTMKENDTTCQAPA